MLPGINGIIKASMLLGAKMTMQSSPLLMKMIHRMMVGANKWKVSSTFKPCLFSYVSFAVVEYVVNPLTEALFVIFVTLVLGILIGKTAV